MGHFILNLFAKAVVPFFFVGLAGSALVVIVTTFRDLSEVWTSDDDGETDL